MSLSPQRLREWQFHNQFRADQREKRLVEWAEVDRAAFSRSAASGQGNVRAALTIIDNYPASVKVAAGRVHSLLKRLVQAAADGANDVNLIAFKRAVDAELGPDVFARMEEYKRTEDLADYCVNAGHYMRDARACAQRGGFHEVKEELLRLEAELRAISKKLRKAQKKIILAPSVAIETETLDVS
ncbi:hypothetical protein [Hyphomicrobium sp. CS1GBMeth3]|uniref:hypothetical protein n=1 Tax=Hyphomicrobium sp. CS1GBMeth3 TaxID=1892845 RepID=UPI00092FE2A2|nr:hypothetical protein [Hyphomicrobium sp. CS1GBMeth3]